MALDPSQDEWWWDEDARAFFPGTVTKMAAPGGVVYLVGTAHGTRASVEDVSQVIRAVQPHAVCIEMCQIRVVLDHDVIDETDARHGRLAAPFPEDLTEFHKAVAECSRLRRGCVLHLIDRRIDVTSRRLAHALTAWDVIRARWSWRVHATRDHAASEREVAALRVRGEADRQMAAFAHAYPRLHRVLVDERDAVMGYRLQQAALPDLRVARPGERMRVVGVVGLAHVTGIVRRFHLVEEREVRAFLEPPPESGQAPLLVAALALGVAVGVGVGVTRLFGH